MKRQFIKASNEKCSFENHIAAPYIRKTFLLDFIPEKAEISICGLGFYVIYINGVDITKGHLAPYISNPDHICYYDTYDIRQILRQGENVIGIILGNGMQNPFGGFVWNFDKEDWVNPPCVAVELIAVDKNNRLEISADETFRVHNSPIIFDEFRMGEIYDANFEIDKWNEPGYDDRDWNTAMFADVPKGELKLCKCEEVSVIKEIKPVSIEKKENGYLYDFGENNAGVCKLSINAQKGQVINMWHAEILNDGEFTYKNIIFNDRPDTNYYENYNQRDVYIAKGKGTETYVPKFTYHGFRYVLVQGITEEQATDNLLTYLVLSSNIKTIGGFDCSNKIVNTLCEMVVRSDRSNYIYFPTDCPHREKNGWTGDAARSAPHMAMMYDVENSWLVWLDNIRKSQTKEGKLPGIIPTGKWGYDWGNGPAWDTVIFSLPYELYKKRGNIDVILQNAEAMTSYLEYMMSVKNENGTVSIGMGDWLPVGKSKVDAPLEVTDSIMVMEMARQASEMFSAVGFIKQADFAHSIYEEMRNTIRRELVDMETMTVKGNCQTSQAMALYYGIFDKEEKNKAFDVLLRLIHQKDDRFDCGCLGIQVIFHVLSNFGESELAYKLIVQSGFPSYKDLIDRGETTLVEWFLDTRFNLAISHNHHYHGDIINWFIRCIAGINIINSNTVEINPYFIKELTYAHAYHILKSGKIDVKWERLDNQIKITISSPQDINCLIKIDGEYSEEDGVIYIKAGEKNE